MNGRADGMAHVFPIRVYYEDTDCGGIVYYANYLKFAERARTELLRVAGVNQMEMTERYGMGFAVRSCAIDYRRPARLDDLVQVSSRLVKLTAATIEAAQDIRRGGDDLAHLDLRIVCVRRDGRPGRIPAPVRHALKPYLQSREHC